MRKLFVGYKTRVLENIDDMLPNFFSPALIDADPVKIQEEIDRQRALYVETVAARQPYTATLSDVYVADPTVAKPLNWVEAQRGTSVAVRFRNYLTNVLAQLAEVKRGERVTQLCVIGFDMDRLFDFLRVECSLPAANKALSAELYYNPQRLDLRTLLIPSSCQRVDLAAVLRRRRPLEPVAAARWDDLLKDWQQPGSNTEVDVKLAIELSAQLRL